MTILSAPACLGGTVPCLESCIETCLAAIHVPVESVTEDDLMLTSNL